MTRILVTGGAGFLGSHLCARLLNDGHSVISADDYSTGRAENTAALLGNPAFTAIQHDITAPLDIDVDAIYNLACPASPVQYQIDPVQTTRTCVIGAINVLDLARRGNATVLQASTSEVYGDPTIHPQPENYHGNVNPAGPRACYDEGKRCAETLFFNYHRQHAVRVKIVRIFNTYGPNMAQGDGRVVSNFIVQALLGQNITLYGSGGQTRSFCYVDDLINGLLAMMATPDPIIGPINLGNPAEISIRNLALLIIKLVGSRSQLVQHTLPEDDPARRCPDITRANTILDWQPQVTLSAGLQRTIAYFDAQLAEGKARKRWGAAPDPAREGPWTPNP